MCRLQTQTNLTVLIGVNEGASDVSLISIANRKLPSDRLFGIDAQNRVYEYILNSTRHLGESW
jgi:hypothetical protein